MAKKNAGHKNLIPPKKGEVRNPKGKPKGTLDTKTILKKFLHLVMDTNNPITGVTENLSVLEQMNLKQIANALGGDLSSYRELIDRYEGKVLNKSEVISHNIEEKPMTDDEIKKIKDNLKDAY